MTAVAYSFLFIDAENRPHHLCLLEYHIPHGFIPKLASHGNAKENKPFHPTWPSTMGRIKAKCVEHGPKATVEHLSIEVGGLTGASAPGELPRNEKQVTNVRKEAKRKGCDCGPTGEVDDLFVVMQRAYSEDPQTKFIRSIRASPDPAIVLAEDFQINDLERFCVSSAEFGILTVDPTFSLGEFDVTPITYHHLLLSTKIKWQESRFHGPRAHTLPKNVCNLFVLCIFPCWIILSTRRNQSIWHRRRETP